MQMSAMKARFQFAECSQLYQKKRDGGDFRKNPSLRVREDWWVFEKKNIINRMKTGVVSDSSSQRAVAA